MGYNDSKEGLKDLVFNVVERVLVDTEQEGQLETSLAKKNDTIHDVRPLREGADA